jgi:hypothetical protein
MEQKENFNQKPLVEKIYDELIYSIEGQEEFDLETILRLKLLVAKRELHKTAKVKEAIRDISEANNENNRTGN